MDTLRSNPMVRPVALIALSVLVLQASSAQSNRGAGVVAIEAAIVYRSGDVVPAARSSFYLLSQNPETVLQAAGFDPTFGGPIVTGGTALERRQVTLPRMAMRTISGPDSTLNSQGVAALCGVTGLSYLEQACAEASAPLIREAEFQGTTGFDGKLELSEVPPGRYYLFGMTSTRRGRATWITPVDVRSGRNSIILDANNAVYSF